MEGILIPPAPGGNFTGWMPRQEPSASRARDIPQRQRRLIRFAKQPPAFVQPPPGRSSPR